MLAVGGGRAQRGRERAVGRLEPRQRGDALAVDVEREHALGREHPVVGLRRDREHRPDARRVRRRGLEADPGDRVLAGVLAGAALRASARPVGVGAPDAEYPEAVLGEPQGGADPLLDGRTGHGHRGHHGRAGAWAGRRPPAAGTRSRTSWPGGLRMMVMAARRGARPSRPAAPGAPSRHRSRSPRLRPRREVGDLRPAALVDLDRRERLAADELGLRVALAHFRWRAAQESGQPGVRLALRPRRGGGRAGHLGAVLEGERPVPELDLLAGVDSCLRVDRPRLGDVGEGDLVDAGGEVGRRRARADGDDVVGHRWHSFVVSGGRSSGRYRRFAGSTSSTAARQAAQRGRVSGQPKRGSIGRRPQGVRRRPVIAAWARPSRAAVQATRGVTARPAERRRPKRADGCGCAAPGPPAR